MDFPFELDHVVTFCAVDAPEAQTLEALGLQGFGGTTQHGGLGTASTSFFFSNLLYLELFWLHDEAQAEQALAPLGLNMLPRMHWRASEASPFGLMLRRRTRDATDPPPFPTTAMPATWMPPGTVVEFNGANAGEPYYGIVPESLSFRGFRAGIPDLPHPLGVRRLTGVTITLTENARSPIAALLAQQRIATFHYGPEPLLTLIFDDGTHGHTLDVRPTLPLILRR
jgi:hypothetical protein